jgi:hypothetical protein
MGCADVRDLLPEHALGTLDPATRSRVDQHLAWCAGCRKEAAQLAEGVAGMGLHLPTAEPPAELEDRVVAAVRVDAARAPRRRAGLLAAALAAVVASVSIGWGVVLAGRAQAPDPRRSTREALTTLESFEQVLVGVGGGGNLERGHLRAVGGGPAGGGATRYDSVEAQGDSLVVVVGGLPAGRGPYTVILRSGGSSMVAGTLAELSSGQLGMGEEFSRDLSGFDQVVVEDAAGRRVLVGSFSG